MFHEILYGKDNEFLLLLFNALIVQNKPDFSTRYVFKFQELEIFALTEATFRNTMTQKPTFLA
jgi:hypothetical protein